MGFAEKDSELVDQARNFALVLSADPEKYAQSSATALAVTAAADAFIEAYRALVLARANGVRSEPMTRTKEAAREQMLNLMRPIYLAVQASVVIPDADKSELGVHIKRTRHTARPVPTTSPLLSVRRVNGSVVTLNIRDRERLTSRARPADVDGTAIFAYVGEQEPADFSAYRFIANTGKTSIDIPVMATPGATVWFAAIFFNARKQFGPASAAARATIGAGSTFLPSLSLAA